MTDDLRTRIAWVLYRATQQQDAYVEDIEGYPGEPHIEADTTVDGRILFTDLADAVIREVLTAEFLADLIVQALQKAADDETH